MIHVGQDTLLRAVQTAGEVAAKGPTETQRRIRVFVTPAPALNVMAAGGAMATCRTIPILTPTQDVLDVSVQGDRLLAGCKALRKGDVQVSAVEGALCIEQTGGVKIELEQMPLVDFPTIAGFENMKQVYVGPNPAPGFEAIKHVAASNTGTTPLSSVLILMNGRSYLASQTSAVRCDFSLLSVDDCGPVPLVLDSTWVLTHFEKDVMCYHEKNRILVCDAFGWAAIQLWAGDLGKFPTTVESTFASLKQLAQIKLPRTDVLRAASAAQTVLRGTTKEPVYMHIETAKGREHVVLSAQVGRHAYRETLTAWASHDMKVPVHVGRFADFLRGSEDEAVFVKVMGSEIVPQAQTRFIHLVDSRLHEVVGLPGEHSNEVKEAT